MRSPNGWRQLHSTRRTPSLYRLVPNSAVIHPKRMLLKEAETVEDGTSSCSDLLLLDFSLSNQFSFVVFGSLDWDNASIVADPSRLLQTRLTRTRRGISRGSFGESVVHRPRSYLCRIASISFPTQRFGFLPPVCHSLFPLSLYLSEPVWGDRINPVAGVGTPWPEELFRLLLSSS